MENLFVNEFPGRCVSCGFLGQKVVGSLSEPPMPVSAIQRFDGNMPPESIPWCFVRKYDLFGDYAKIFEEITKNEGKFSKRRFERSLALMFRMPRGENGCERWHEWKEGFDPRWHYEDWRMMELERLRQQQAGDHLAITKTLASISAQQVTLQRHSDASTARFNIFFGILAVLTFLLAIAPLAYPNGVRWAVDSFPGGVEQRQVESATPQSTP